MLAAPLRAVLDHGRPVLETDLLSGGGDGRGCSPMARSGIYAPLRARGSTVGLIAIEDTTRARYGPDDVGLLTGLTGPLALAVDNALWFLRLRRFGAEAERARIARDLHDRLAQSLAYIAFELERLAIRADGEDRHALDELHDVVRGIVGELRETLYQLRAGPSEDADLERVARDYLARYEERTGLIVHWRSQVDRHLPYQVEQELWRMMQEALINVEHHAEATACTIDYRVSPTHVSLTVEDDGRGFEPCARRRRPLRTDRDARARRRARCAPARRESTATGHPRVRRAGGTPMTTVLIADDHQLLRQALRRAMEDAGLVVLGEAADGAEAVQLVDELRPELVIMDVTMPVLGGIEATRRLHAEHPELPIVVLTMHDEDALREEALRAGASAFLSKDSSMQEVVATAIGDGRRRGPVGQPREPRSSPSSEARRPALRPPRRPSRRP